MKQFRKMIPCKQICMIACLLGCLSVQAGPLYKNKRASIESRIKDLMKRMTLEDKTNLLYGIRYDNGAMGVQGIPSLDIPPLVVVHGPYAGKFREKGKPMHLGTHYPVSIALAATWNDKLIQKVCEGMGEEMNAFGAVANAGPAMNIIRDPRTGRTFEYFTEDPYLNERVAIAYTKGLESKHVATLLKHYACNNQEYDRHWIDVQVSERALREIYLPGFEAAIVKAGAHGVMSAYNLVNGVYCGENKHLLTDILRDDWDFKGLVLSDWGGTHSTVNAAKNGLDIEMPRSFHFGKKTLKAVKEGKLSEKDIDKMVKNILHVLFWSGAFDNGTEYPRSILRSPAHLSVAREAAGEAIVLLKNDDALLPVNTKKTRKIAVIGPNGNYGAHFRTGAYHSELLQGGGSASIPTKKEHMITPFQGLLTNAPEGIEVKYAPGCYAESGYGPIPIKHLQTPNSKKNGCKVTFYTDPSFSKVIKTQDKRTSSFMWKDVLDIPEAEKVLPKKNRYSIKIETILTAPETGMFNLQILNSSGTAEMYLDGNQVTINEKGSWFKTNSVGRVQLEKGKKYNLEVRYNKTDRRADVAICWDYENKAYMAEAKKLAKSSDMVILTVGLSGRMGEREYGDRNTMNLPDAQVKLIKSISEINPNCVVTIVAGSSITMDPWIKQVPAVVFNWYAGEQGGHALADVIYGQVNPSGRLPITFVQSENQYPSTWYSKTRKIYYDEGVFVGYRYFDKYEQDVLFPFGYGLSYTQFEYSNLKLRRKTKNGQKLVDVTFDVKNVGKRIGAEVPQIYVHDVRASVERPKSELKDFQKLMLKPGETKKVTCSLDERAFSFYSEKAHRFVAEPGLFDIFVGKSSRDIQLKGQINWD